MLVAAPLELGVADFESVADGVALDGDGVMLPVPLADDVDGLLMLPPVPLVPLVDGDAGASVALLGVEGVEGVDVVDAEGVAGAGLVSLLLQPYTVVSAAAAKAIEMGLSIICETYRLI